MVLATTVTLVCLFDNKLLVATKTICLMVYADTCRLIRDCRECSEQVGCSWSTESFRCLTSNSSSGDCPSTQATVNLCEGYRLCQSCVAHGCVWNGSHCSSQSLVQGLLINPCTVSRFV